MCSLYLCKVYLLYSAKYKVTLYYESLQQVDYSSTLHIGWHTCFLYEMFELLRIWSISQYLAAHFDPPQPFVRPWLTSWSTIVAPILGLVCLCTLPPRILTPLLPLGFWPWLFPVCSSIFRIFYFCVVLCLCMLSNWRILRCTFELFQRTGLSLVDLILFISESETNVPNQLHECTKAIATCSKEWETAFMMCASD